MNKTMKIITITLCVCLALGIFGTITGAYIRGGIAKYSLPDGFEQDMQQVESAKQNGQVRIMTSNLLVHYKSWGGTDSRPRAKMYFEMINIYQPDVIGVQEMSDQWYDCIMRNKANYKMLYPVSTGVFIRMTGLMYNSESLELIDKGQLKYDEGNNPRLRRAVWGIFKSKETNEIFAVISTHFDTIRRDEEELMLSYMETQKRQIIEISNSIKKEYNIPVFSIGDFNTMNPGDGVDPIMDAPEVYQELCESLTDTILVADLKENGDALDVYAPTWDHIFLDGDAQINRYAIISPKVLSKMSDHYPIFIDVTL